jgi:hypothetical protein
MIDEFSSIYTVHITLNIQLLIINGMYSIIYIYIYDKATSRWWYYQYRPIL